MRKSDLKDGMIVETRERGRYLVHGKWLLNIEGNNLGGVGTTYYPKSDVRDDLTDGCCSVYDIMKLYKSNANNIKKFFDDDFLELIWSREDNNIKVGDEVEIVNSGQCYKNYNNWVERHIGDFDLRYKFDMGHSVNDGVICEVLYIAKNGEGPQADDTLAYVKHLGSGRCYLISVKGLKKVCD